MSDSRKFYAEEEWPQDKDQEWSKHVLDVAEEVYAETKHEKVLCEIDKCHMERTRIVHKGNDKPGIPICEYHYGMRTAEVMWRNRVRETEEENKRLLSLVGQLRWELRDHEQAMQRAKDNT